MAQMVVAGASDRGRGRGRGRRGRGRAASIDGETDAGLDQGDPSTAPTQGEPATSKRDGDEDHDGRSLAEDAPSAKKPRTEKRTLLSCGFVPTAAGMIIEGGGVD